MTGFEGFLDRVGWDGLVRWARDPARPSVRLQVDVFLDGVLVETVAADQVRTDLLEAGKGDGRHGFIVHRPPPPPRPVVVLTLLGREGGREIVGAG